MLCQDGKPLLSFTSFTIHQPGPQMIAITLKLDPRTLDALTILASKRKQRRLHLVRDIIYTAIWNEYRGEGMKLRAAPRFPTQDPDPSSRRVMPDPNAPWAFINVQVDEHGLMIDEATQVK